MYMKTNDSTIQLTNMKTQQRLSAKNLVLLVFCIIIPTITFAQWSNAFNLSPNAVSAGLNESMGTCIGVSGDTVHIVWVDRLSTTRGVLYYICSLDSGLTWSNPVAITDTSSNIYNPAIAVNGPNVHVVWREITPLNKRNSIYKHSLDGGNTWGAKIAVDTSVADWPAVTVSGNTVYVANDIVVSAAPFNTEIFFLRSLDNGFTWSPHTRITNSVGRSEDEAIAAEGSHVHMSWNDNRGGLFKIYYKESADYGVTWSVDTPVIPQYSYSTMVSVDGANVDIPGASAPVGRYQMHLAQSADTGATWAPDMDLTSDTAHEYVYPDLVRDGSDLHLTYVKLGAGAQYVHSGDGGASWSTPFLLGSSGITTFVAYTGCVVHVIVPDSGHINYFRNPTGNYGRHCSTVAIGINNLHSSGLVSIYPNPFTSQTTIEISASIKVENAVLRVFDVLGEEMLSANFGSDQKIILNKGKLNSGVYFYEVSEKSKIISTGKILIE